MHGTLREKYINTHIDVLDKLLGKATVPEGHGVIEEGSIVVIRGEPGCGKTTLGLQILSNYLKNHGKAWGGYFSLEKPPEIVINKMKSDFGMFSENQNRISLISADKVQELLRYIAMPRIGVSGNFALDALFDKYLDILSNVSGHEDFRKASVAAFIELVRYWKNRTKGHIRNTIRSRFIKDVEGLSRHRFPSSDTNVILIDSVNALTRLMGVSLPGIDERVLLSIFLDSLKKAFGRVVIFTTSEAARGTDFGSDSMSESYLCDVQLLLKTEPVTVARGYMGEYASPVGYSIAKIREDLDEGRNQVETRPFCRVVKSRDCEHECRRVSYEFVSGTGLRFYEIFPGDGRLMIFAENAAQESWWADFIKRDLPNNYPALRYEIFNRENMQTIYDGRRQLNNMSLKTDLFMSAFDSYWIRWYCDRKLKDEMQQTIKSMINEPLSDKKMAVLINGAMRIARDRDKTLDRYYDGSESQTQSFSQMLEIVGSQKAGEIKEKVLEIIKSDEWTYIKPLNENLFKRYGERGSQYINAIKNNCLISRKGKTEGEFEVLSVPYDANVSFVVYRKDIFELIKQAFSGLESEENKPETVIDQKVKKYIALLKKEFKIETENDKISLSGLLKAKLTNLANNALVSCNKAANHQLNSNQKSMMDLFKEFNEESHSPLADCDEFLRKFSSDNKVQLESAAEEGAARIIKGDPPQTIEEMAVYCEMTGLKYLIDTRTFDTFLCYYWEMVWNCGGDFRVHGDYSIEKKPEFLFPTFIALYWVFWFFKEGIIPENSSIDPDEHTGNNNEHAGNNDDWIFARHWYSTFIDLLTRKEEEKEEEKKKEKKKGKNIKEPFVWIPDPSLEIEIMPFPVAMQHLAMHTKNQTGKSQPTDMLHTSTLGEWHWAILRGTENESLGIDLVNSLMTSQKIWERASKCAALPTVEAFYDDYGDMKCVNVKNREKNLRPDLTFKKLNNQYINFARTRNGIYDYRHCARVIHSLLTSIAASSQDYKDKTEEDYKEKAEEKIINKFAEILCSYVNQMKTIESFFYKLNA